MKIEIIREMLTDPGFSWPLAGIALILASMIIRFFLLHDILRELKYHNKAWHKSTQDHYQRHCLPGWIFYILAIGGMILIWRFESFFARFAEPAFWVLLFIAFLILSYLLHLRTYMKAIFKSMPAPSPQDTEIPRIC